MRRHLLSWLSRREPSLPEVWNWHRFQRELLDDQEQIILADFDEGRPLPGERYLLRERFELVRLFDEQRTELGNATMLLLLAATEAALRVDFVNRVARKGRDATSRAFTQLYKEHGLRTSLEAQLLEVYKQNSAPEIQRRLGDFLGALKLRHWLAHGRYWTPKFGQRYDPDGVFTICRELTEALGLG